MNVKVLGGGAVLLLGVGGFLAYEEYQKKKDADAVAAAQAAEAERDAAKAKQKAGSGPEKQAEVPDLKGMTEGDALDALKAAGFTNAKVERQADNYICSYDSEKDMLPLDTICEQSVGAGAKRSIKDLVVKVTIERDTFEGGGAPGYEWHRMPDLEGLPLADARQLLADKGFKDDEFELKEGVCDKGIVCDTIPDGGQRKLASSKGTLKIGGYKP